MNHTLGNYISIAYHDPKKYPKKPFSEKEKDVQMAYTDKQREAIARAKYRKANNGKS